MNVNLYHTVPMLSLSFFLFSWNYEWINTRVSIELSLLMSDEKFHSVSDVRLQQMELRKNYILEIHKSRVKNAVVEFFFSIWFFFAQWTIN